MLSQQNVSFSDREIDISSHMLVPVIAYPQYSESEYKDRVIEMESLGIRSVILDGRTTVKGAHIAGKGCVGIVIKAKKADNSVCALKIRRTDAVRKTMDEEVRFHKIANSVGVGPHLEGQTKNLIAMEYVTGQNIGEWISQTSSSASNNTICRIGRDILEQCFRLDNSGLDHGELSRLTKHVIVSNKPCIIDFESASTGRKTCNVTAAAQSIFLYGIVADKVRKILGNIDKEKVIRALRTYKHLPTRANFDAMLGVLLPT